MNCKRDQDEQWRRVNAMINAGQRLCDRIPKSRVLRTHLLIGLMGDVLVEEGVRAADELIRTALEDGEDNG